MGAVAIPEKQLIGVAKGIKDAIWMDRVKESIGGGGSIVCFVCAQNELIQSWASETDPWKKNIWRKSMSF